MSKLGYQLVAVPPPAENTPPDAAYAVIQAVVTQDMADISRFPIPDLKIGTLDALVSNAEDLARLDTTCEGYVYKVADILKQILQGDRRKMAEQEVVGDRAAEEYLAGFQWNTSKYRSDRSIAELMQMLAKDAAASEQDVRTKFSEYNAVKSQLTQFTRRQTGNLSTRALADIVRKEHVLVGSDYLVTLFFAIPKNNQKDWEKAYETLTPMVVPRSSQKISQDEEFALYNVVVFKKHAQEFAHKARELKFIPRDFTYDKEEQARSREDLAEAKVKERKLWGDVLRLARAAFGDTFMAWVHLKALRVYVESVLRYGLPARFCCVLVRPFKKQDKAVMKALDDKYAYLQPTNLQKKKQKKEKGDKTRGGQEGLEESVNAVEGSLGLEGEYRPFVVFPINWTPTEE
ncbi:ATPase V1 complex subunit C [Protomyces lactucae-debilis]|uniref:V-type proton ATPase subunit C n=1 Tax=Protomyces lactucae-debilis TaxID=2754530 RepID=A0A1Y2EV40_PROLT|nr:ATPase V1 complex subunit C [Protomyces lactucae-debilis]ORY75419.1 ATPase V1 complex subunit C [Protomyces lactucae-debilis]